MEHGAKIIDLDKENTTITLKCNEVGNMDKSVNINSNNQLIISKQLLIILN